MDREIKDEQINDAMKRVEKSMHTDIDSEHPAERTGQLMILCIQEGYKQYMIELEDHYLNYSNLNKSDKFYCTQILEILNNLNNTSKDKIERVLINQLNSSQNSSKEKNG